MPESEAPSDPLENEGMEMKVFGGGWVRWAWEERRRFGGEG